jgi:hypothetical protein
VVAIKHKASPHHVLHSLAEDEEELAIPFELVLLALLLLVLLFVFIIPILAFILFFGLLLNLLFVFLIIDRRSLFCLLLTRCTCLV